MKIAKRIVALLLSLLLVLCGILEPAPLEAYAAAVSDTISISNDFVSYTLNKVTGGFSIDTIEGHPQKDYDDNIPLLYKESRGGMETSYITLRLHETGDEEDEYTDYIWGQDYSWLLGPGEGELQVKTDSVGDNAVMEASWTIRGVTVTQTTALSESTAGNDDNVGNVAVSYTIQNNNEDEVKAGLRVLVDTALSNEIDAPYLMTDDNSYSPVEKSFTGEVGETKGIPSQIRGVDSLSNPNRMCYAILDGWEGKKVDQVILGHWANLANRRYDYTANPNCDYTNQSNEYYTADSAMVLYWNPVGIATGEASEPFQFLYGVGNFTRELENKKVNINMTVGTVSLDEENPGQYADGGEFDVEATIDNTVTNAEELEGATLSLNLEEGLTLVTDAEGDYTTEAELKLGEIAPGQLVTKKFRIKAEPQKSITAKEVAVSLNTVVDVNERASRYVILPNASGEAAKVKFSGVTPPAIYFEGDRSFTLAGDFKPLIEALRGNAGWALKLVAESGSHEYTVDKKDIAFDTKKYKSISAIVKEPMTLGDYKIVFEFTDETGGELVQEFGNVLDSGLKINVSDNPELKDPSYGLISMVRYENSKYAFITFTDETQYNNFLKGDAGATFIDSEGKKQTLEATNYYEETADLELNREVLVTLRGKVKQLPAEGSETSPRYIVQSPSEDGNVTINNVISCEGSVNLYYSRGTLQTGEDLTAYISGEGDIRVINSISFWKSTWNIKAPQNTKVTMGTVDPSSAGMKASSSKKLSISLGGAAKMIQSIGGMVVNLKYAELTRNVLYQDEDEEEARDGTDSDEKERAEFAYGVGFGGRLSIPISITELGKKKTENTPDAGGGNGSAGGDSSTGGNGSAGGDSSTGGNGSAGGDSSTGGNGSAGGDSSTGGNGSAGGDSSTGGNGSAGGNNPPTPDKESEYEPNDGSLLTADIQDILFGDKRLKYSWTPEMQEQAGGIGYIGTNVTVGVGLPENILGKLVSNAGGAQAVVTVNTIEGVYTVSAGMKLAILEVEGTLGFKTIYEEVDSKTVSRTLPDILEFRISDGLRVPIVPPTLFMSGIGGGVSGLADTVGGNYVQELPPLTISVYMALTAVEILEGEFEAQVNAFGMSLDGVIAPRGMEMIMQIAGGISTRWIDPFYLNVYGSVNVLDGLINGGITITIKKDYFYGYAYVALVIPPAIPLLGGKELARIEAAVSDRYIGANVKIIGIGLGVIYYFDSGDVDFGGDIDLGQIEQEHNVGAASALSARSAPKPRSLIEDVQSDSEEGSILDEIDEKDVLAMEEEQVTGASGETEDYTIVVGSNLHKLKTTRTKTRRQTLVNAPKARSRAAASASSINWSVEVPKDGEPILIQVPFQGDEGVLPKASDITLQYRTAGSEDPYHLAELKEFNESKPEEGNLMIQQTEEEGGSSRNYIFITLSQEQLKDLSGDRVEFVLTMNHPDYTLEGARETLYQVDTLPELTSASIGVSESTGQDAKMPKVDLMWDMEGNENYNGKLSAYITTKEDAIEAMQDSAQSNVEQNIGSKNRDTGATTEETSDLGTLIWEKDGPLRRGSEQGIELPDTIPSGSYYLVMTASVDKGGASTAVSASPIAIENKNLPRLVSDVTLTPVGDQQLRLDLTDSENYETQYNEYYVELYKAIEGEEDELVASGFHQAGSPIIFGRVIQAAVEDDPETEVDETVEEKVLEIGESYYAIVKTSRLVKTEVTAGEGETNSGDHTVSPIENYEEKRYISDDYQKSESIEVPQVNKPVVKIEDNLPEADFEDQNIYTKDPNVEIVYSFDQPVDFTMNLDGLDLEGLSSSEDKKVWTFQKTLDDGEHTLDFTAMSTETGDTLMGKDSPWGCMGVVVDTQDPVLAIGGEFKENSKLTQSTVSEGEREPVNGQDERFTNVSAQTVMADENGSYTIIGQTEPDIRQYIYTGGNEALTIEADGSFTIQGQITDFGDKVYREEKLTVYDKAGNESSVTLYILNGAMEYPDEILITNNGEEIPVGTDGIKTLEIQAGQTVNLKVFGLNDDGERVVISEERLLWDTLYEGNLVNLDRGRVTSKGVGESAVKVLLPYSVVSRDQEGGDSEQVAARAALAADDEGAGAPDAPDVTQTSNTEPTGPEDLVRIIMTGGEESRLTFQSGGGSGENPSSITQLSGTTIILPENPYTKEGREFEGWMVKRSDGTVDARIYRPGESLVVPNEDVIIIAKWKGEEVVIPTPTPTPGGGGGTTVPSETPTPTPTETPQPTLTPGEIEGYTPKIKCEKNMATQVKISWEKLNGVDGYYVYKKLPGGKWQRTDRVSAKTNTYTFKGLKSVQKYYFTVKAYVETENGEYVYSKYMTDFRKQTRPEIPEISVKDKTHNTVTIQWKGVPRARMYYIYKTNDKGKREIIKKLKGTRRSYVVKGLESGRKYHLNVRAMAYKMPSEYPEDLAPITLLQQPKVKVQALGGGKVKVNWTKIPGAEKYNVYYRPAGGKKWTTVKSLKADKRTYTIGGLKKNRTYEFSVKGNAMVGKRLTYSKHLTNVRTRVR